MPGLVVSLDVEVGREVKAGEAVAVIEAMKMQNLIKAERDGVVKAVGVKPGDSVAAGRGAGGVRLGHYSQTGIYLWLSCCFP